MNQQSLKQLFAQALEYESSAERETFLAGACRNEPELRQEVDSLLIAHEQAGVLFDRAERGPPSDFALETKGIRIGRYRLLVKIGEGGFGVVYMAEQEEPVQRKVALKIIKAGMDTREVIARFEAERQALALMDHPNIARVLDGGTTEAKRPYFVMELVRGIPLTDYCDQKSLSTRERLRLFVKVCQAVQHAHQKAVIHRDLKPSNILVTLHDGEPVPKVIDFGVAKALGQKLTEKTLFTSFRQMIGTPAYMSPEQAEMSGLDVDTRTDIYSLGVLLYELLTGVTPFDKEILARAAFDEIRRMIRETEPPKPSTRLRTLGGRLNEVARHRHTEPAALSRLVRGDLDWVVMKCLEKDRTRRYETANGLAMDLKRFLNHEPVTAAAPTFEYRLAKFTRRHRTALLTITSFVLLLVGGAVFSVNEALKARRSAVEADQHAALASQLAQEESQQHRRATEAAAESRERLRRLNLANGNRLLEDGDYFSALTWFAEALSLDKDRPDKEPIDRLRLTALTKQCPRLLQMWFHQRAITSAEFSQDGRKIVTASEDQTARVWDVDTGQPLTPPLQHTAEVVCAHFSPDGRHVLTAARDQACLWNAQNGHLELTFEHVQVEAASFSPDGRLAATASYNGTVKVWDIASGRLAEPVLQHRVGRRATQHEAVVAFSPDSRWLVTAAYDRSARIWSAATGEPVLSLDEGSDVRYAQFSPDNSQVATANWAGSAHLWDIARGEFLVPPLAHQGLVDHVSFSPQGEFVVTSSIDGTAKMWDTRNGRLVHSFADGKTFVMASAFSADGKQLLLRNFTGQARTWSVKTGQPSSPPLLHGRRLAAAQFHPDGLRLLTGCLDGSVRLWDLLPEGMSCSPWEEESSVLLTVSSGGRQGVTQNANGKLQAWDTTSWTTNGLQLPVGDPIQQAWISLDEQQLLTVEWASSREATDRFAFDLKTWDIAKGTLLRQTSFPISLSSPYTPLFVPSPDCRQVAFGSGEGLEAWDLIQGKMLWRTGALAPKPSVVCYSPDATRLAIRHGRLIELLDSASGKNVCSPLTNRLLVTAAAFSPDGQLLAGACGDDSYANGEVRVWQVATGKLLQAVEHEDGVSCVAFSPDGSRFATGTESKLARVFDAKTGHPLTPFMRHGNNVVSVAFSQNGLMLATASADGYLRVWDAWDGEPITPPLNVSSPVDQLAFVGGGRYLAAQTPRSWELLSLETPEGQIEDLISLARLLAGHHIDATGMMEPLELQSLSNAWSRLHVQFPQAFAHMPPKQSPVRSISIPARDPEVPPNLIDLGLFYNAALTEDLMNNVGNSACFIPRGVQAFEGTQFEIRGLVQLGGTESTRVVGGRYPESVNCIPLSLPCKRLHFLIGTHWSETDGVKIGSLLVRYSDGQVSELPIVYGEDVRDWWCLPSQDSANSKNTSRTSIAWRGENRAVARAGGFLRLYKITWQNAWPGVEVNSIDFASTMTRCAPFLVAITVE